MCSKKVHNSLRDSGFTLIELVGVLIVLGIATTLFTMRLGTFTYWREEGQLRAFTETIEMLYYQALADQAFYQLEIDFDTNSYKVGVLKPEYEEDPALQYLADAGNLTFELAAFQNPVLGRDQSVIAPPNFPSLAKPVELVPGMFFTDVKNMRGEFYRERGGKAYLLFSPAGFSEFGVIHLRLSGQQDVTVMINPFTGLTEIFRDYRDIESTVKRRRA